MTVADHEAVRVECPGCGDRMDTDRGDETYCWECGQHFDTAPHVVADPKPSPAGDLFLVLTAYEDPHPHVEGVFTDRDDAEDMLADCAATVGSPHPLAWSLVRVNEYGYEVLEP